MRIVMLCEQYKMTYEEYCDQPSWFWDLHFIKQEQDALLAKRQERRSSRKAK